VLIIYSKSNLYSLMFISMLSMNQNYLNGYFLIIVLVHKYYITIFMEGLQIKTLLYYILFLSIDKQNFYYDFDSV